jgi:hypothetical protein
MGGPRARTVSQSLLGGQESVLPFGIGLQEFVPFSPYVGEEAGAMVREGQETDSGLTTGLGIGMGALQALPVAKPLARGAKAATMTAGRAGERLAERVVPQVMERGGLGAEMLGAMGSGTRSPLTAYHGTPHKFAPEKGAPLGKFKAGKIGTGEGAQAYGHGIYFAENPKVAGEYRFVDASIDPYEVTYKGKSLESLYESAQAAQERAHRLPNGPSKNAAIDKANAEVGFWESLMTRNHPKQVVDQILDPDYGWQTQVDFVKKLDLDKFGGLEKTPGHLYTVDIPDEMIPRMLDWDKPLSQQSKEVREILLNHPDVKDYIAKAEEQRTRLNTSHPLRLEKIPSASMPFDENRMFGKDVITAITQRSGAGKQGVAEQQLQQAGIPGIQYLDAGSRDTGKGTRNFVVFPGEEEKVKILERKAEGGLVTDTDAIAAKLKATGMDDQKAFMQALRMADARQEAHMAGGGLATLLKPLKGAPKAEKPVYTAKQLESTAEKLASKIKDENPKLSIDEVMKRADRQAKQKLEWEKVEKPDLEKRYGALEKSKFSQSLAERQRNVPEVVQKRIEETQKFLSKPTEPWTPPRGELQAFDRERIKDALDGFPGVSQTKFPRYEPAQADLGYISEIYDDPVNRELIKGQIKRGLPLGGETFYASLYPLKLAALERGIPEAKFNEFIYSIAPASARNSIMNEMAVGQFMRDMKARGLPLDEDTVKQEMAAFKEKYGTGLPLMPVHRQGVQAVLEGGQDMREMLKADIPTNYKIPTYGTQKAGDFGKSMVLDVHESAGQTRGSRYHPYFTEQGGFGPTQYGAAENKMLGIAGELGIPGGMAQAGRWFGGGELTGLKSPRGDALDLLEKQTAYTLQGMGITPTPKNVRNYVLDMIGKGEGVLMPWFKKEGMPDVRTEKKKGGLVRKPGLSVLNKAII